VQLQKVRIMFQGGFVGQQCSFQKINAQKQTEQSVAFYPTDTNDLQE
jgi:hypothetical protein